MSPRSRLIAEVKAMQDDQRYGVLTHPVMLGVLIAIHLLDESVGHVADTDPAGQSDR